MEGYSFETDTFSELTSEAPLGAYEEGSFEAPSMDGFGELSGEAFGELEGDVATEGEGYDGFEFEGEGDPFFGSIWRGVKKAASAVAPLAKRFAPQIGTAIGGALGGPAGAALLGKLGSLAQQLEGEEMESEEELNAPSAVPPVDESLSESMADSATKLPPALAQSMGSAITVTVASRAPLSVKAVVPVLARASGDIARQLAGTRDPRAKTIIRVLPTINKKTISTLTAKARNGRPVTPRTAIRVMRTQANRVLNNPQTLGKALANNAQKRGQLNRAAIAKAERFM